MEKITHEDKYRYLQLSLDLKILDYNSIVEVIKNALKEKEENELKVKILEGTNKLIPDNAKDNIFDILELVFKIKGVKEKLAGVLEKNVFSKIGMKTVKVKKLSYKKKENKALALCIGIEDYDYSEIFGFVTEELNKSRNKEIPSIAVPAVKVLEETLSDDRKDTLIVKLMNGSGEGLCRLIEKILKERYGIEVALENLQCQSGVTFNGVEE